MAQRVPLWGWVVPDRRMGAADDPAPAHSATSDSRFPSRVEHMAHTTAHHTSLIVMMPWEVGFIGELNWESDVFPSSRAGLFSILSLTTENPTFQVTLKGNLCGVSLRVCRCPEAVALRKRSCHVCPTYLFMANPALGLPACFTLICSVYAAAKFPPRHTSVLEDPGSCRRNWVRFCGEGRALCLSVTN